MYIEDRVYRARRRGCIVVTLFGIALAGMPARAAAAADSPGGDEIGHLAFFLKREIGMRPWMTLRRILIPAPNLAMSPLALSHQTTRP